MPDPTGNRGFMKHRFFQSRAWIIIQTVVASAALFLLGFEMGSSDISDQLEKCRQESTERGEQVIQLTQERNDLERRLQKALKLPVPRASEPDRPTVPPADANEVAGGLLHMNRAEVLLDGRLILTLEDVDGRPRKALIRFRAADREQRKALAAGQEVTLNLEGRRLRLLIKQITTASARYSLIRVE